jgi:hypothetical protein
VGFQFLSVWEFGQKNPAKSMAIPYLECPVGESDDPNKSET